MTAPTATPIHALINGERVVLDAARVAALSGTPEAAELSAPRLGAAARRIGARVIVASDRAAAGTRPDATAPLLLDELWLLGFDLPPPSSVVVADDTSMLAAALHAAVADLAVRFVVTTGGTGASPRDVTPEATRRVITRELPGFGELMRAESLQRTIYAAGSRALAGTIGDTLIVNLPGSPRGAVECLSFIARPASHVLELIAGNVSDCEPPRAG